jgi:hypothetical protein
LLFFYLSENTIIQLLSFHHQIRFYFKLTKILLMLNQLGSTTTANATNEVKPIISLTKDTTAPTTTTATTTSDKSDTKSISSSLDTSRTQTLVNAEASLPTVSSYPVPGLTSSKNLDGSAAANKPTSNTSSLLGSLGGNPGTGASSSTPGQVSSNTNDPNVSSSGQSIIRSQSIKDQPLPQQLLECVENFK